MELSNKQRHILHVIRNPDGFSVKEVRLARLDAANEIERLIVAHEDATAAYLNMREFAEESGLNTWARNPYAIAG